MTSSTRISEVNADNYDVEMMSSHRVLMINDEMTRAWLFWHPTRPRMQALPMNHGTIVFNGIPGIKRAGELSQPKYLEVLLEILNAEPFLSLSGYNFLEGVPRDA